MKEKNWNAIEKGERKRERNNLMKERDTMKKNGERKKREEGSR